MLQQVSMSDGVTLIGDPVELLDREEADGMLVEAPNLFVSTNPSHFISRTIGLMLISAVQSGIIHVFPYLQQ